MLWQHIPMNLRKIEVISNKNTTIGCIKSKHPRGGPKPPQLLLKI